MYQPIGFVKEKIKENREKEKMYKEYKKLKEKAEKSDIYLATIRELQDEITGLKDQLKIDGVLSEYTYIHSNVINRNVGTWYNTLTIDKGKKKGIEEGIKQNSIITAEMMIQDNEPASKIMKYTRLSFETLQEIAARFGKNLVMK